MLPGNLTVPGHIHLFVVKLPCSSIKMFFFWLHFWTMTHSPHLVWCFFWGNHPYIWRYVADQCTSLEVLCHFSEEAILVLWFLRNQSFPLWHQVSNGWVRPWVFHWKTHVFQWVKCAELDAQDVLYTYGFYLGLAFQIADDVLDFTGGHVITDFGWEKTWDSSH